MKLYLLLLLTLIVPLTSIGKKRPKAFMATLIAHDSCMEASTFSAPAIGSSLLKMPITYHPQDTSKQKRLKKVEPKKFPKPQVSKKTSKRKARKAKTSH